MYLGMRKIFIPLVASVLTFSLVSCSDDTKENRTGTEGKGGVYMGGVMRMNEVEAFKSLNPIAVKCQPTPVSPCCVSPSFFRQYCRKPSLLVRPIPLVSNT